MLGGSPGLAGTIERYAAGDVDPRPLVAATVGLDEVGDVLAGWRPAGAGAGPKIHIDPAQLTVLGKERTDMSDFDGLVAVVTGGASGIGAATAELLRRARRAGRRARPQRTARSQDGGLLEVPCDVGDARSVRRGRSRGRRALGGIDILVNNAGIGAVGDVAANDDDEWHRVLDVNVVGIARVTRAALPHLLRVGHASRSSTPARWCAGSAYRSGRCTRPARGRWRR